MSRLESPKAIEKIVGARRHATDHLGRAISAEERVYILHSTECAASGIDLRTCVFSEALDYGIDMDVWGDFQDVPVVLAISDEYDDLEPVRIATTEGNRDE
ncbi:MAG: hypothetical protein ABI067_17890 [Leifsonia sp.]